jgi:hypothetical protein
MKTLSNEFKKIYKVLKIQTDVILIIQEYDKNEKYVKILKLIDNTKKAINKLDKRKRISISTAIILCSMLNMDIYLILNPQPLPKHKPGSKVWLVKKNEELKT